MSFYIKNGIDLVEDERILKNINNQNFLDKVFLPQEQILQNINKRKLVSIFSIKEAVIKALELQADNWLNIEITYNKNNSPEITLSKNIQPKEIISTSCSVTHSGGLTIAMVTMLIGH